MNFYIYLPQVIVVMLFFSLHSLILNFIYQNFILFNFFLLLFVYFLFLFWLFSVPSRQYCRQGWRVSQLVTHSVSQWLLWNVFSVFLKAIWMQINGVNFWLILKIISEICSCCYCCCFCSFSICFFSSRFFFFFSSSFNGQKTVMIKF